MATKYLIIIIILSIIVAGISGCTSKIATNGTFGEKKVSIDSIVMSNNTTAGYIDHNGTEFYYIQGYVENHNPNDAFHVIIETIVYDKNGNIIATNSSPYLEPVNIPANGYSFFYVSFKDPNQVISRYEIKVTDAKSTL